MVGHLHKDHTKSHKAGESAGVRAACQRFLLEAQLFAWQFLLVGSGLWLEEAVCTERFFADLAEALDRRKARFESVCPGWWDSRIASGVWGGLIRVVRWCEPRAKAWRRLATETDMALLERDRVF